MPKFLIYLLALAFSLSLFIYIGPFSIPSYAREIILYMTISTAAVFFILQKKYGPMLFTQMYLLTVVMKMLTGSIFILIVIFIDRPGAHGNALLFIISYMLFTALEVAVIYRNTNNQRS